MFEGLNEGLCAWKGDRDEEAGWPDMSLEYLQGTKACLSLLYIL